MSVIRNLPMLAGIALLAACASHAENQPLTTTTSQGAVVAEGVPGGVIIDDEKIVATVVDIDHTNRKVTLQDDVGNRQTIDAPADMRNFSQLRVGDRVTALTHVERSMYLRGQEPAEMGDAQTRNGTTMVVTPEQGSKPGLMASTSNTSIAVVKALDIGAHTVTLLFADGNEHTYKLRPDVAVKPEYLNREVIIRQDSQMTITVEGQ